MLIKMRMKEVKMMRVIMRAVMVTEVKVMMIIVICFFSFKSFGKNYLFFLTTFFTKDEIPFSHVPFFV